MSKDIMILSSSADFTRKAQHILSRRKLDYPVFEAAGDRALEIGRQCVEQGTKVIITRGNNLILMREHVNAALIDVRYTYEDIHFSLQKAKQYSSKIAYSGFGLAYDAAVKFKDISGENFPVIQPNSISHVYEIVEKLSQEGFEVFIGGITVAKAAKKYGVKNIMIEVDERSLEIALDDAISVLNFELERRKNYETIKLILNSTSEGIIGIDQNSQITYINDRAKKLITDKDNDFLIDHILNHPKLNETIREGKAVYNELLEIGENPILLSGRPIRIDNSVFGAVASIQKADYVQSAEKELRRKLSAKGHVAKKNFKDIIGKSEVLLSTIEKAKKFARSQSTVLITGESGTGKEIFAQSIHNYSKRHDEPFVALNCAALPQSVLESELFGYVKGAFTGARSEGKTGIFELAHNGTVFLDEVGEMSGDIQAKLLRVIQEREIMRIGDDKVTPVDVRIISATNKNLLKRIEENEFREDLYYRLCVLELQLPTLDERKEDVPLLAKHFISRLDPEIKVTNDALNLLSELPYKGNIRQLNNIIERLVAMCEDGTIDGTLVSQVLNLDRTNYMVNKLQPAQLPEEDNTDTSKITTMEKQLIREVLEKNNGNKTKAAKELGISYATLWRKLKQM
jgi:sigma-54 dependent transcriptional regulator, acetoin dehydrogenase operon transcriptional activator AcoR